MDTLEEEEYVLAARDRPRPTRYDRVKRLADAVTAAIGLVVFVPVLLAVAAVVALTLGRPVLFRQSRPGRHGRPFTLVKFRTMRPDQAGRGVASDPDRLTAAGRLLGATSLDELPTLWNVVRGDMSIVGPRPLLMQYLDRYTPQQARRHEVRPGVTGLTQVRGRNLLCWEDRFALDLEYVENRSLALDARILAETIRTVLRHDGIAAAGQATMTEFVGSTTTATSTAAR